MSSVLVRIVGSADAFNAAGRGHSCYWIEGLGEGPLMVDFGATALAGLGRLGLDPSELCGLALTHLHGDHVAGLPFLVIDGIFRHPRGRDLEVVGPVALEERLDSLIRIAYGDVVERERAFELACHEIRPGQRRGLCGAVVEAQRAEHMDPPDEALILTLSRPDGPRLVFTGDTTMTDELRDAARGADLLVAECSALSHPAGRHCVWEDWRAALASLGVRRVVLSHLSSEVREAIPRLREEVPEGVDVVFAEDGMAVTVPPHGDASP